MPGLRSCGRLVEGGAGGWALGECEDRRLLGRQVRREIRVEHPGVDVEITAPPYEWPTSTIGPSMPSRSARTCAASEESPRSGLGATATG